MRWLLSACLLLLVGLVVQAGPSIKGRLAYGPHDLVTLEADMVDPNAGILWQIYPGGEQRAKTPKGLLQFAAPPGKYVIDLLVVSQVEKAIAIEQARVTVEIAAPMPPVPPAPMPTPPGPTPPGPIVPPIKPDPMAAIGRIQLGGSGCTATVIYPRRPDGRWNVCTAAHCVANVGQQGTMRLRDGRSFHVQVGALDRNKDCAWLITVNSEPDLPYAILASASPANGSPIWHAGYGVDNPGNLEKGVVLGQPSANDRGMLWCRLNVSSGDSGGAVALNANGEVVGVVCCTTFKGAYAPMYCGSSVRLLAMLAEVQAERFPLPKGDPESFDWKPLELPICK